MSSKDLTQKQAKVILWLGLLAGLLGAVGWAVICITWEWLGPVGVLVWILIDRWIPWLLVIYRKENPYENDDIHKWETK